MSRYSAKVEGGVVVEVLVGDVDWASEKLGGEWHDVDGLPVSVGWTLKDGEWRRPAPAPSWTWDGSDWVAPKPQPDPSPEGSWAWDEDAQDWVLVQI